jgi:hypothetical protein
VLFMHSLNDHEWARAALALLLLRCFAAARTVQSLQRMADAMRQRRLW